MLFRKSLKVAMSFCTYVANTINSSFTKKGNKNLGDVAHLRK
jgi:hypothetical protein